MMNARALSTNPGFHSTKGLTGCRCAAGAAAVPLPFGTAAQVAKHQHTAGDCTMHVARAC